MNGLTNYEPEKTGIGHEGNIVGQEGTEHGEQTATDQRTIGYGKCGHPTPIGHPAEENASCK